MTESQFNTIAVFDAVPDGELSTARRLKEDLLDISCYTAEGLQVRYFRVETIGSLKSSMAELLDEIKNSGLKPWLHFDGHGFEDQSGIKLAEGDFCSWDELKAMITPLNIELGLNLILVLATCFGGSFARAIDTIDRAPLLGLIGPSREIKAGEVEKAFPAFYKTFFDSQSLSKALDVLESGVPPGLYFRTTAEKFFYEVWKNYKKNYCTKKEIDRRARKMYRKEKKMRPAHLRSVGQFKRMFRSQEITIFERFRDAYFMYDLHDFNKNRFPVTYKKAETYVALP